MHILSHIPGCRWPAVPTDAGAQILALQFQLERSQWLPAEALQLAQAGQLQQLLAEASGKIDYWREALKQAGLEPGGDWSPERFTRLPVLGRMDVQRLGGKLASSNVPSLHGRVSRGSTSGSTGTPVAFYQTELTQHFWRALTLREHFWQRRDFAGTLAAIRSNVEAGELPTWGPATEQVLATGRGYSLDISADVDAQLDWLVQRDPDYLLTHPSNLKALAKRALERGATLPRLRQLRTFGEVLSDETRALCRRAWQVDIADVYSSEEAGYIALQCEHGAYHVQAENLLVEIVDAAGVACPPGTAGRVLITTLHNFAMPLIRYDIGDYAEWGSGCPCGRGLPVLRRIMGRRRNMLELPDGTRHWPSFPEERWVGIAPIQQLQVVQKAADHIVLKIRSARALTAAEESRLTETFKATLRFPYRITIEPVDAILRGRNMKFEDFVSEIA